MLGLKKRVLGFMILLVWDHHNYGEKKTEELILLIQYNDFGPVTITLKSTFSLFFFSIGKRPRLIPSTANTWVGIYNTR